MRQLLLYYSNSGNNKKLARFISKRYNIEAVEVKEIRKKRNMFTIAMDTIFSRRPKIEPLTAEFSIYDRVYIIAPLWMGKIASPMLTALQTYGNKIQSYSYITLSGGPEESKEKTEQTLNTLIKKENHSMLGFSIKELLPEEQQNDPKNLMQFTITDEHIQSFAPALDSLFS